MGVGIGRWIIVQHSTVSVGIYMAPRHGICLDVHGTVTLQATLSANRYGCMDGNGCGHMRAILSLFLLLSLIITMRKHSDVTYHNKSTAFVSHFQWGVRMHFFLGGRGAHEAYLRR